MSEEPSGEIPGYMKDQRAKKQESVEKASADIEKDRNKFDVSPRFGYFSIPYPAICNDKAYSKDTQFQHHKIVDGKVITEPRGIYTQPSKKGTGKEAYFSVPKPWTSADMEEAKKFREKEKQKLFEIVDKRRKNESKGPNFKDPGPQEMFGFYKVHGPEPTGPIYKEIDRFKHIGPDRRVIIENRGIYVNPPKKGTCLYPNDYFSFYFTPNDVIERIKKGREEDEKNKLENVKNIREKKIKYQKPFVPASLKKNDLFSNNFQTYGGLSDAEIKTEMDKYKENKKKGNPKYIKIVDSSCVNHSMPFRYARLKYSGRDGLFNDDLYKMPQLPPEKKLSLQERLAIAEKNKKEPFRSCKLMSASTFAPCISSFVTNLKRDYPSITFN